MSGHNRWSKLKRRKVTEGAAKGKLYNKLIKELTVSARLGGGDPAHNARLRVAMASAREANMPAENISRAVKKGTGELEGVHYEEIVYEGYGPGGVAILVECLTDNRNRTVNDVRNLLTRNGGHFGTPGTVSWMFHKKGLISTKPGFTKSQMVEKAIDAGAEDVLDQGAEGFDVLTEPAQLHAAAAELEKAGVALGEQKWVYVPASAVRLEGEQAQQMLKLMELLEDSDDVQSVHANFEIDEALMASLL